MYKKTAYLGQSLVVLILAVGEYDVTQVLVGLAEQLFDPALLGPVDHVLLVQHQDVGQVAGEAIPARKDDRRNFLNDEFRKEVVQLRACPVKLFRSEGNGVYPRKLVFLLKLPTGVCTKAFTAVFNVFMGHRSIFERKHHPVFFSKTPTFEIKTSWLSVIT